MQLRRYSDQLSDWPKSGRHILAQFDAESVVVYQAYRPSIARFAVEHQLFGGEFSMQRMSWIKPNFMWMMHRSGWGTKPDQEIILAVRLKREDFDEILSLAVHSSYCARVYGDEELWHRALEASDVRLQWDPDHDPEGGKLDRRVIQLGLKGDVLARYARDWIVEISDISKMVAEQRENVGTDSLFTPLESVYPVIDSCVAERLLVDSVRADG